MREKNPFDTNKKKFTDNINSQSFDEIIKDSTSTKSADKTFSTASKIIWGFVITILLGALLFVCWLLLKSEQSSTIEAPAEELVEVQSDSEEEVVDDSIPQSFENPVKSLTEEFSPVEPGKVEVVVDKDNLVASPGSVLSLDPSLGLKAPEMDCVVENKGDFCLGGIAKLKDSQLDLFFLKDAVNNRLFDEATNFETVTVKGASKAFSMILGDDSDSKAVLLLVNKDGSGFMIRYPSVIEVSKISSLLKVA